MPAGAVKKTEPGRDKRPATVKIWNPLVRIFHWSLVVLLLSSVDNFAQGADLPGIVPYRERCAGCHGQDAAAQAHRTLKLDGPSVMLSRSGALLDGFLGTHGRADGRERQELVALFQQILSEDKAR